MKDKNKTPRQVAAEKLLAVYAKLTPSKRDLLQETLLQHAARTQSLVLGAFYDLIIERGYDGFTVRDLIDRADVGRSTFYEHFENKDDVFERSVAVPRRSPTRAMTSRASVRISASACRA